jgi:hypothetical protein
MDRDESTIHLGSNQVDRYPADESVNIFEDRTWTACKGRSKIPCPVQGCFKGSVADFEMSYSINGVGRGAQVLQWPTPTGAPG